MTKKQYLIYTAIAIIVLWVGIFFISTFNRPNIESYDKKLDSLTTVINNAKNKIELQEQKDIQFEKHISKIDSQFVIQQDKINKLKKYYDIKIKAVDNASSIELYNSITDRYK